MTAQQHSHRRGEDGTAIVEFIWLALLLLVPLVYIVLGVFETQRAAYAASAAARSAGRAFVTAPTEAAAYARAHAAARLAFADQGADGGVRLTISCVGGQGGCLSPGSVVTAHVASAATLPLMPDVLGSGSPRISVSADHREPYGRYREAR